MKILAPIIACLLLGCIAANKYTEGTMTQIGAYMPYDGQLVGVEVINYMNGCKVTAVSNNTFNINRTFCATNDYLWGMVKTIETTNTKVNFK